MSGVVVELNITYKGRKITGIMSQCTDSRGFVQAGLFEGAVRQCWLAGDEGPGD